MGNKKVRLIAFSQCYEAVFRTRDKSDKHQRDETYSRKLNTMYLSVLVQHVSEELVSVGETLRSGALAHADHAVLFRMENSSLQRQKDHRVSLAEGSVIKSCAGVTSQQSGTDGRFVARHGTESAPQALSPPPKKQIHVLLTTSKLLTCLPMGSGLVTVVLKKPSHSSLPYSPAQWL